MKKVMLLASLAMAAAAFAAPSTASAVWTHNHQDLPAANNPVIHGEGTVETTSQIGGTHCSQVTLTMQLTGGTTTEHIQQFTPNEATCKTTGALAGCTITSITTTGFPWTGHINGTTINQTGIVIQKHIHGFLCPSTLQYVTQATKQVTIQPDETGLVGGHTTITNLTIGGSLHIVETGGTATMSGNIILTASSTHTYGFT
jgi:hypothetical protein